MSRGLAVLLCLHVAVANAADAPTVVSSTPCLFEYRQWWYSDDRPRGRAFRPPPEFTAEQCTAAAAAHARLLQEEDERERARAAASRNGFVLSTDFEWMAPVFFAQDWCPTPEQLATLKGDYLVEMNGCCIRRAEAFSPEQAWRAHHPSLSGHTVRAEDLNACTPISDAERARIAAAAALEKEAAARRAEEQLRRETIAAQRAALPKVLREMTPFRLCAAFGTVLRGGELHGFEALTEGAVGVVRSELRRRGLAANEGLAKTEKIRIGINECTLVAAWGLPSDINRTVSRGGVHHQFVYRGADTYVYTENGVVSSWQD